MTKKPHADTGLAKYIERRVLELKSKKSQLQIASEAGFPNPNMVTMIKTGTSKLALDRVPSMARALDVIPPSCCAWRWNRPLGARQLRPSSKSSARR